MNCENCGNELKKGDLFCVNCGAKVENVVMEVPVTEVPVSEVPVTPIAEVPVTPIAQAVPVVPIVNPVQSAPPIINQKKKKKTGLILGLIAAVLLLVALFVVIVKFIPMNKKTDNSKFFYVEDNELFMTDLKKMDSNPIQLNDEYKDDGLTWSDYGFLYENVKMSSNGKAYYFPTALNDEYKFNLSVATVKKGEAIVNKIDSNVSSFELLNDDTLIYVKQGKLYSYDGKNKNKIATNVGAYYISKDQKSILWMQNEGYDEETYEYFSDIYYQTFKGKDDAICIEKKANFMGCTDNFDSIYLIKKNNLYRANLKGKSDKIVSNCSYMYSVDLEKNEFYYTSEKEIKISLLDFLDDPYKETDKKMREPSTEDFEEEIYDEFWGYTYTETDWDAYYEAYYEYEEIYTRDVLRADLKEYDATRTTEELYFFDGKKETLIIDNFDYFLETPTKDQFICSISEYKDDIKISIDDLWDVYDLSYRVDGYENIKWSTLISYNGKTEIIEDEELYFVYSDNEKLYYAISNEEESYDEYSYDEYDDYDYEDYDYNDDYYDEDYDYDYEYYEDYEYSSSTYTLYSFDLSKNKFATTEEITDEMNSFEGIMNGKPYYICNVDDKTGEGDLYCGTEEIASNVRLYSVGFKTDENAIMFSRDVEEEDMSMTLVTYKSGKENEIAEDITYFTSSSTDYIVFLQDFSWDDTSGDLMLYNRGKIEKIASNVSLFSILDDGLSGSYYGCW